MQKEQLIFKNKKGVHGGFLLVEAILAGSVFVLIVTAFVGTYLYGQESTLLSGARSQAALLAEEGLEAVRNIRDEGLEGSFANLTAGAHGLAVAGGQWAFSGSSDTTGIFTRQIIISDVDADHKDITSTVTWQQNAQRVGSVSLVSRLTNWQVEALPNTIFYETFPVLDNAWNGSSDTQVDEPGWVTYQGPFGANEVQLSNEDVGTSPSGSTHLTFESADQGFQNPEQYDIAYVPINLAGYMNVTLSWYWQSDDVDAGEGLRVAYSTTTTNGIDGTWVQIAQYLNPTDDVWTQGTYALPNTDALAGFALRFSSLSDGAQEHMFVDDVRLTGVPDDFVPPGAVSNLSTSNPTENSLEINWTAPGDDGSVGTAASYDIRYSTSLITEANWASATQVVGEPAPQVFGSAQSMVVNGLSPDTTYYFAMKTLDETPNISDISNVPNGTTLTPLLTIFYETFPSNDAAWNGSSDTAQDEPGWVVRQGNGDADDVQVSNEDVGASPSGGSHLTFEDADQGFQNPTQYDSVYAPVDLSSYAGVTLSWYWQSDDVDAGEGLRVAYSTTTTNGIDGTWVQIAQYLNPTDDVWTQGTYALPNTDALAGFALRFSSLSTDAQEHMLVDDVTITGYAE